MVLIFSRSLKSDIGIVLEATHSYPGVLRIEARKRFLARLIEATDSALSKHDQVLIPATTRLGRVKATIPACVACDRPLRNKGRRPKECDEERKEVYLGADQGEQ